MANSRDVFALGDRASTNPASDDKGDGSLENLGETGFRASLRGATLPDLVQLECLAQSDAAFRITSQNKIGHLFFQKGQIVHALTGDLEGEAAALEILKWQKGVFEPCNVAWPDAPTVHSGWQNILLLAAQARDESGRHNLVAFPKGRTSSTPPAPAVSAASSGSGSHPRVQEFVRMDHNGNVLSMRGPAESLASLAAYVARLSQLIGESLALEPMSALECEFRESRSIIHVERNGNLVALKAALGTDLSTVRERLGL
jgi:Domain of unknown function (DUF4388)